MLNPLSSHQSFSRKIVLRQTKEKPSGKDHFDSFGHGRQNLKEYEVDAITAWYPCKGVYQEKSYKSLNLKSFSDKDQQNYQQNNSYPLEISIEQKEVKNQSRSIFQNENTNSFSISKNTLNISPISEKSIHQFDVVDYSNSDSRVTYDFEKLLNSGKDIQEEDLKQSKQREQWSESSIMQKKIEESQKLPTFGNEQKQSQPLKQRIFQRNFQRIYEEQVRKLWSKGNKRLFLTKNERVKTIKYQLEYI